MPASTGASVHRYCQSVMSTGKATINLQRCEDSSRMIVSGTAGTGKSYLIHCLRLLLQDKVRVVVPTGVAAFSVDGHTLHSLLNFPTKGGFKDIEGEHLNRLQQLLARMEYLIIDEMSMVGRKMFGQVDRRLRQVFPHHSNQVLGGCSVYCLVTLVNYPQ